MTGARHDRGNANRRCPLTDAVLARHLDGDVDLPLTGAGAAADAGGPTDVWLSAEAVAEHLRDCAACRAELQRARRLDAALAESSGRALADTDPARLHRLLERACAAAAPAPTRGPSPAPRRGPLPMAIGALLLFGFGFGSAWLWRDAAAGRHADPVDTGARTAAVAGPLLAPAAAHTGPAPAGTAATSMASDGVDASHAGIAALPEALPPRAVAPSTSRAERFSPPRTAAEVQAIVARWDATGTAGPTTSAREREQQRHAALRALLDSNLPGALQAFATVVAAMDEGWLLHDTLAQARRRPATIAMLRAQLAAGDARDAEALPRLALVTLAARLGHRDLDLALRGACRRTPDLHTAIAAALSAPLRGDAGAPLLLDLWGDLVARGVLADDERGARALFLTPGPTMVGALADEFDRGTQTTRRIRCLLAMGVAGDARALPHLRRGLRAANQPEAFAAAWALGELPPAALAGLLPLAEPADAWILRAALVRARLPGTEHWYEQADLSAAERDLLVTGRWSSLQFATLATLLRSCRGAGS